ncbi:hypothetical protein GGQ74_000005 [Desulfobaculum xiamenense]|uniref:Uncharacterized protein n=1 Tax=Desulfobaculum xiamenense TaxID=995050 RepID=A0A846QLP4_9BACT|nr:hypothetical protein [Desulfobaculum xiamenense]NJB66365.1 hypothetical protein [Desulfobaculum xiamenense]
MEHVTFNETRLGQDGLELDGHRDEAHEVQLADVEFTTNAKYTIGLAVKEIAAHCGMLPHELTRRMRGRMFWQEATEDLMIVFAVPELEADMMIEIPKGHWRFRGADGDASQ